VFKSLIEQLLAFHDVLWTLHKDLERMLKDTAAADGRTSTNQLRARID
jgi:hypothetical protein